MNGMTMHPALGTNWGHLLIWIAFASSVLSAVFYIVLNGSHAHRFIRTLARGSYALFALAITVSSILLMGYILNHNFLYRYVVQYSSKDLPLMYLVSSFWAGQAGSFLLWVFFTAWLGFFIMRSDRSSEAKSMIIYGLNNIFLMILLIKQSPFSMYVHPSEIPLDGNGLNMLLQDPWMVIHPPIVFLGYAAYAVPFSYAVTGMWEKKDHEWIMRAFPWVFFAFATLGAGIIIGGYWSYKVLGWGGYWAWDPVENASLLPWLFGMALMHGMILQRAKKMLIRTNFFLAALTFIMVIYCTFLTRSGILADFSVHSFSDLGITELLVLFMFTFIAVYLFMALRGAWRRTGEKEPDGALMPWFSRELFLIGAIVLLSLSALVTGLGTSAPLITGWMGTPSKVPIEFYNKVNLPFAVLMMVLLCVGPLMTYGANGFDRVRKGVILAMIGMTAGIAALFLFGFPSVGIILLSVFSGACILVSGFLAVSLARKKLVSAGGAVSHLGLGLMFAGIVASSVYDSSHRTMVIPGGKGVAGSYEVAMKGVTRRPEGKGERLLFQLDITRGGDLFAATPDVVVEKDPSGRPKVMYHPFIKRGLLTDLYISPVEYNETASSDMEHLESKGFGGFQVILEKDKEKEYNNYKLLFTGFETTGMGSGMSGEGISVKINILVTHRSGEKKDIALVLKMTAEKPAAEKVRLPGPDETYIHLDRIDATTKSVSVFFEDGGQEKKSDVSSSEKPENTASLLVEMSIKPGMTVLWIGTFLLLFGGILAIFRRR